MIEATLARWVGLDFEGRLGTKESKGQRVTQVTLVHLVRREMSDCEVHEEMQELSGSQEKWAPRGLEALLGVLVVVVWKEIQASQALTVESEAKASKALEGCEALLG